MSLGSVATVGGIGIQFPPQAMLSALSLQQLIVGTAVHNFSTGSASSFAPTMSPLNVATLITIYGGGGGGVYIAGTGCAGGGGGGEVTFMVFSSLAGQTLSGTVGGGGAGNGTTGSGAAGPGGNSTITINGITYTITGGTGATAAAVPGIGGGGGSLLPFFGQSHAGTSGVQYLGANPQDSAGGVSTFTAVNNTGNFYGSGYIDPTGGAYNQAGGFGCGGTGSNVLSQGFPGMAGAVFITEFLS